MPESLDAAFSSYCEDREANRDALLVAVRNKGLRVFKYHHVPDPEDAAQDLMIDVWKHVAGLPSDCKFNSWLNGRMHLHVMRIFASDSDAMSHLTAGPIDPAISQEEYLSRFQSAQRVTPTPEPDLGLLADKPLLKKIADGLLCGFTQEEVARSLGMSTRDLKAKLHYVRKKKLFL